MSNDLFEKLIIKIPKRIKGDNNKQTPHIYNETISKLNEKQFKKIFLHENQNLLNDSQDNNSKKNSQNKSIDSREKSHTKEEYCNHTTPDNANAKPQDIIIKNTSNNIEGSLNGMNENNTKQIVQNETTSMISNTNNVNCNIAINNNENYCSSLINQITLKIEPKRYIMFEKLIQSLTIDRSKINKRPQYYFTTEIVTNEKDMALFEELLIYSKEKLHPFSFSLGQNHFCFTEKNKKKVLKIPGPKFIPSQDYCRLPDIFDYSTILAGSSVHNKKGLICVDKNLLVRFKGIVADMISQILKRLFGGPPVSLNVRIFDTQSSLHRNAEAWSYAPLYLKKASNPNLDPVERLKHVIAFTVSGLIITSKQLKPFNPHIGETFQGEFPDKTHVYAEHIGHYPTLSRFYMLDYQSDYKLHGCFDLDAITSTFGGEIVIVQKGNIHIDFPKINEHIIYQMPKMKLENCRSEEERNAFVIEFMEFTDLKNNLKALIKFGYNESSINLFFGAIYSNNNQGKEKEKNWNQKYITSVLKYSEEKNVSKKEKILGNFPVPMCLITGNFISNLLFDNKEFWNLSVDKPFFLKPCVNVLPSDTRFREDLIWLYFACYYSRNKKEYDRFMSYSQQWKLEIEYIQRKERGIRADFKKTLKPSLK